MRHVLSAVVQNVPGVLAHISGMLASRGYNIDSLAVGETEDPTVSRITIVAPGDERTLEQIIKQLNRLIDVIRVRDISKEPFIGRQLMLIRVKARPKERDEIIRIAGNVGAKVVEAHEESLILEVVGDQAAMDTALALVKPFGVQEMVRTGRIALSLKKVLTAKDLKA